MVKKISENPTEENDIIKKDFYTKTFDLSENEYYKSITFTKDNEVYYDSLKLQLMDFVLNRLKEISNEENR